MTIDTTIAPRASAGVHEVRPGDEFTAVVSDDLEWWRVVAVLGIRVLAERIRSGDRHTFTLRFVRYRLAVAQGDSI
ncbi:hypothetical protein GTU73_16485 [Rathayibacter sp. VKM Ac-2804]|uniref:hypothetical protein n=1 Tax=unclassified Rathayibacter TaxID=2609250 RepID=UPI00132EE316|nr:MULTISPECIES: hypothetical protein [unclassified Rathayibacter]NRG41375.1 hypothetical protein [Rathayibacter sp. VKM Ac-2835]QHF25432.1 hypothetical protein GTU73_16485 [Rathayibacter sp. VKM Ac-2804]